MTRLKYWYTQTACEYKRYLASNLLIKAMLTEGMGTYPDGVMLVATLLFDAYVFCYGGTLLLLCVPFLIDVRRHIIFPSCCASVGHQSAWELVEGPRMGRIEDDMWLTHVSSSKKKKNPKANMTGAHQRCALGPSVQTLVRTLAHVYIDRTWVMFSKKDAFGFLSNNDACHWQAFCACRMDQLHAVHVQPNAVSLSG
jgi:hypothetical protein